MLSQFINRWNNYVDSIDWDRLISIAIHKLVILILIALLFFAIHRLGTVVIDKAFKKYEETSNYDSSRIVTLQRLSLNIFHYTIFFFVCYSILSLFGIPVASLIAGAGIAGVAIGLGAQGFINDLLTGFFIILERQIEVGDEVTINGIQGVVQSVGLRTTQIKSFDGVLNFIPNRTITIISNASREERRVKIDFRISPSTNIDEAIQALKTVSEQEKVHYPDITNGPDVVGIVPLPQGQYVLRTFIYVKNGAQDRIQHIFTALYLKALQEHHIEVLVTNIIPDDPPMKPVTTTTTTTIKPPTQS